MCSLIKKHPLIIPNNSTLILTETHRTPCDSKNMKRGANMYSASINNTCLSKRKKDTISGNKRI
jgi:hypothetical protein